MLNNWENRLHVAGITNNIGNLLKVAEMLNRTENLFHLSGILNNWEKLFHAWGILNKWENLLYVQKYQTTQKTYFMSRNIKQPSKLTSCYRNIKRRDVKQPRNLLHVAGILNNLENLPPVEEYRKIWNKPSFLSKKCQPKNLSCRRNISNNREMTQQ